jgi:hypothetical protein
VRHPQGKLARNMRDLARARPSAGLGDQH